MTSSRLTATSAFIYGNSIFWKYCIRLENVDKTPVYLPDDKSYESYMKGCSARSTI
jgi:hypothetical protein